MKNPQELGSHLRRKVGKHVIHETLGEYASQDFTLDLGCGHSPLAPIFPNRVGLDITVASGLNVVGDGHALPFKNATFEQIVCSEVLEHLADPHTAVSEMARVLKPGSRLLITTPFVYPLHEAPHDYQRFTQYGLRHLFEPYFEIHEIQALFTEEQTMAVLLQRIAFQREDNKLMRYFLMGIAHLLYRFPTTKSVRYQGLNRDQTGPFLTAGYFLLGTRRN